MSLRSVVLTILSVSLCANAQPRTVALHVIHSEALNSLTAHAFDLELKRLITPAGIELNIGLEEEESNRSEEVAWSIHGAFRGNCTTDTFQLSRTSWESSKVLGSTPVSDDYVLPYFTVDCDRLSKMLSPALQPLTVPFRERILGRALARVVAHELYHILAQTTDHDVSGIAKAQLSYENLVDEHFDLSPASLLRMNATPLDSMATGPRVNLAALEWMQP